MSVIRSCAYRAGARVFDARVFDGARPHNRGRNRPGGLEPGIVLPATAHLLFRLIEQAQLELLLAGYLEPCDGPVGGRGIGQQSVKRVVENSVAAG